MKGFKMQPQPSKKDQFKQLETELKNSQVATRMTQILIQQMMSNMKSMAEDLNAAVSQLYELQYKYDALRQCTNVDVSVLGEIANKLRLADFEEAAKKADAKEELFDAATVSEDTTVVLTSTATDEGGVDKGIFRSRIKLSESGSPDLMKALLGKKVGEKVSVKLNGLDHTVELLSAKDGPAEPKQETSH